MLDLDLLVSSFSALSVDFLFGFVAFLTVLNLVGSRRLYFGLTNLDCNLATLRCIFRSFSVLSCCRTKILTVFFFGKYSSNGFGIFDSTIWFASLPTSKNAMYGFELILSLIFLIHFYRIPMYSALIPL